jgi:hypothetical protein
MYVHVNSSLTSFRDPDSYWEESPKSTLEVDRDSQSSWE